MTHHMNMPALRLPARQTAVSALAVIGFVALVGMGMWLAVYSTRFVPSVVSRIGEAAVYVGSIFTPAATSSLSVVPTPIATTTLSFGGASATTSPAATDQPIATHPQTQNATPAAGTKTDTTYEIGTTTTPAAFSGLPDFIVTIDAVGYLATTSADSFVASSTVPAGSRPAVKFSIKNIGTNVSGAWRFSASIPTQVAYIYQSQPQQPLGPGDRIDYTLGFDQANRGTDETISITANFDHAVTESNFNNNSAAAKVTVLGN